MIPEEDRGPAWLRGYGSGGFEADIKRLEEFAARLEKEVLQDYVPHMRKLQQDMAVQLPPATFPELFDFLNHHRGVSEDTSAHVQNVGNATGGFATAAKQVSSNYGQADAFAAARAKEIEAALNRTGVAAPPKPGTETTGPAPATTDNTGVS